MTPNITEGRPPFIKFETRESGRDEEQTKERGYPIPRLVDFVLITPMGSKDVYEKEWVEWIADKKRLAMDGRFDPKWIEQFEFQHKEWKAGREVPLNGTPLEGWPLLAKMQVEQIRAGGIHTVEDLAEANEDAIGRIGMGGRYYRDVARKWKAQAESGKDAKRLADLEQALSEKDGIISELQSKMAELETALEALQPRETLHARKERVTA